MATIAYAHELLHDGRPFSAHEVFEARWKAGPEAERELWQGLAQQCVGITHAERGNRVGALRLVGRTRHTAEINRRTREDQYAADVGSLRPTEAKGRRRPRLGLVDLDTGEINDL